MLVVRYHQRLHNAMVLIRMSLVLHRRECHIKLKYIVCNKIYSVIDVLYCY